MTFADAKRDEAIAAAGRLLLTVPNQLDIADNSHFIEAILSHMVPAFGWRDGSAPATNARPAAHRGSEAA